MVTFSTACDHSFIIRIFSQKYHDKINEPQKLHISESFGQFR